jgi:hypothetical protein
MKKTISILAVAVGSLFFNPNVEAQSANNYIPEIKLLASPDGRYWDEDIKNIEMGQSYYLMVEASVRVPGRRLQWFGANEILCTILFPEDQILDINLTDADISVSSFSLQQNVKGHGILGPVGVISVVGAVAKLVADKIREQRHNRRLNEFLFGNHSNTFNGYSFPIPTSPVNDNDLARGVRSQTVSLTFRVDPLQSGSQIIKIFYESRVSDIYMKAYTLIVN